MRLKERGKLGADKAILVSLRKGEFGILCTKIILLPFIDLYILFLGWSRLQGRVKQGSRCGNMTVSQVPEGVWLH